jgi:hypothetical protein
MSTKLITVEMAQEYAERLLPILREERDRLDLQIRRIEASIRTATEGPKNESVGQFQLVAPSRSSGGQRAKKGESQKLILEYLRSIAPKKAAAKEVASVTKTAYGTALRILRNLKERGDATSHKRLWGFAVKGNGTLVHDELVGLVRPA